MFIKTKMYEYRIDTMNMWLDACIKTCDSEIEFYNILLESGSTDTREFASKQIEINVNTRNTLKFLRHKYDVILEKD
jgi:hypothetical protein